MGMRLTGMSKSEERASTCVELSQRYDFSGHTLMLVKTKYLILTDASFGHR